MGSIFISGIDTDVGKTIATGLMARYLIRRSQRVITQKMVQTGCGLISDDILVHRKLMGCGLLDIDRSQATLSLEKQFDTVLIEGAGGLMVPLNPEKMVIDHIVQNHYPVILVSSSRLGSINHAFLSIEALKSRKIRLLGIVYNTYPSTDPLITWDSIKQIRKYMLENQYEGNIVETGRVDISNPLDIDFHQFFP